MIGVDASGQIYDEEFDLFFGMFYFINFKTTCFVMFSKNIKY